MAERRTSTLASVQGYIASCEEQWRTNGPRRAFGVFACATNRLIGSIEANLEDGLVPGEVNVSYGVFPEWRGKGVAQRALDLMSSWLKSSTELRQIVGEDRVRKLSFAQGGPKIGVPLPWSF